MGYVLNKILGIWGTPSPRTMQFWMDKGGYFQKLSYGSKTLDMMTSEGLGEMFQGDFADMCIDSFLIALAAGQTGQGWIFTGKVGKIFPLM
jgi:hypothetical protein